MNTPDDLKILLAEDNKINQRLIVMILAKLGKQCDLALNGKEALEMYSEKPYDLILMDMQMPEMDGVEASRQIRKFEKESGSSHRAFIVALTANERYEKKDLCLESGMDDFLQKPLDADKLREIIVRSM